MIPTKMQLWYPKHTVNTRDEIGIESKMEFECNSGTAVENNIEAKLKKKHRYERKYTPTSSDKSDDAEIDAVHFLKEDDCSGDSSRTNSPDESDREDNRIITRLHQENEISQKCKNRRFKAQVKRNGDLPEVSDFIDPCYWRREVICCGTIYRGEYGEILSDPKNLRPCAASLKRRQHETKETDNNDSSIDLVTSSKSSSDNSSDDEYPNQKLQQTRVLGSIAIQYEATE